MSYSPTGLPLRNPGSNWGRPAVCPCCAKHKVTTSVSLFFQSYEQLSQFFGGMPDETPWQVKAYLASGLRRYAGNANHEDTDPVDDLQHFWFCGYVNNSTPPPNPERSFSIHTKICNKCLKEYSPPELSELYKEASKIERNF